MSFNELTKIDGLQGLVALRELYLANNKIGAIEGLHGLPALRLLELGSNRLRTITQVAQLVEGLTRAPTRTLAPTLTLTRTLTLPPSSSTT